MGNESILVSSAQESLKWTVSAHDIAALNGGELYLLTLLAVALAPSLLWLWFFWSQEGEQRRPLSSLIRAFLYGTLLMLPCGVAELFLTKWAQPIVPSLLVFIVIIGPIEELFKYVAARQAADDDQGFNRPSAGIVFAAASALGFGFAENLSYFASLNPVVIGVRTVLTLPMHVLFTIFFGSAIGRVLCTQGVSRMTIVRGWLLASLAHGLFDALLSSLAIVPGLWPVALAGLIALVATLVVQYRRLLREDIALVWQPPTAVVSVPDTTVPEGGKSPDEQSQASPAKSGSPGGLQLWLVGRSFTLGLLSCMFWFQLLLLLAVAFPNGKPGWLLGLLLLVALALSGMLSASATRRKALWQVTSGFALLGALVGAVTGAGIVSVTMPMALLGLLSAALADSIKQ